MEIIKKIKELELREELKKKIKKSIKTDNHNRLYTLKLKKIMAEIDNLNISQIEKYILNASIEFEEKKIENENDEKNEKISENIRNENENIKFLTLILALVGIGSLIFYIFETIIKISDNSKFEYFVPYVFMIIETIIISLIFIIILNKIKALFNKSYKYAIISIIGIISFLILVLFVGIYEFYNKDYNSYIEPVTSNPTNITIINDNNQLYLDLKAEQKITKNLSEQIIIKDDRIKSLEEQIEILENKTK